MQQVILLNASYFTPANNSGVITVSAIADFDGKCGAKAEGQMVKAGNFSGIENDDSFAPFSNYGKSIDIAAPGVNINSTNIKWDTAFDGRVPVKQPLM